LLKHVIASFLIKFLRKNKVKIKNFFGQDLNLFWSKSGCPTYNY